MQDVVSSPKELKSTLPTMSGEAVPDALQKNGINIFSDAPHATYVVEHNTTKEDTASSTGGNVLPSGIALYLVQYTPTATVHHPRATPPIADSAIVQTVAPDSENVADEASLLARSQAQKDQVVISAFSSQVSELSPNVVDLSSFAKEVPPQDQDDFIDIPTQVTFLDCDEVEYRWTKDQLFQNLKYFQLRLSSRKQKGHHVHDSAPTSAGIQPLEMVPVNNVVDVTPSYYCSVGNGLPIYVERETPVQSDLESANFYDYEKDFEVESPYFHPIAPHRCRRKKKQFISQSDRVLRPRRNTSKKSKILVFNLQPTVF